MSDNRKHARTPSGLRCWCEGDNVTFYARVGNLSEGGLFLRTNTPLGTGSRAILRLTHNGEAEVQAMATVVWARGSYDEGPAGMGLRFEPLDSVTLERLRRIITLEQKTHGPPAGH
ncbi:TIGR02266 family protein [Myxococcaceae bacterium GXIMD 01537]